MKAFWNHSLALITMLGLTVPAGTASAGDFGDFVKGQIRQQINTPQQTPITKAIGAGKKVAGVVLQQQQQKTIKFPNGNTGIVGPKVIKFPGTNLPIDQVVNGGINIPIDPGIGNGQGANNHQHPILDAVVQQILNDLANNGQGGNGGGNGNNNGNNNGGNNNGNGQNNNGNVQTFAQIDLELHDATLVDLGDETMGPAYRLTVRNNSQRSATSPFVAVLMASQDAQPTADSPYNTVQVPQLAAGQSTTVDVRLPAVVAAQPESFGFLTAAVGSPAGTTDQDNSNNQAAFQRSSVSEIPAKVTGVSVDETAGHMVLEGEGFGSKSGEVFLTVAGQKYKATVKAWGPAAVYFTIDGFQGASNDTASFTLVRNDGRLAPSLDVAIAN